MELVKTSNIASPKRTPRIRVDKSARLLSIIYTALKNEITPVKFAKLYSQLSPRDQGNIICHFIKPVPPPAADSVTRAELETFVEMAREAANQRKHG